MKCVIIYIEKPIGFAPEPTKLHHVSGANDKINQLRSVRKKNAERCTAPSDVV